MKPLTTYIFYVIGTLTPDHVSLAIESMRRQQFHWERCVVYNASPMSTEDMLAQIPRDKFDDVLVANYDPRQPKSCAADWLTQMRDIGGTDRYFSHKADFYLADGVCEAFDSLDPLDKSWFVPFNKFDMKARATPDDLRRFASLDWDEAVKQPDVGPYNNHMGKVAIPFMQSPQVDGTMHGYTDAVRSLYEVDESEYHQRWGYASSIAKLQLKVPFIYDKRFFALHMWHDSPDRTDPNKNRSPEERF